MEKILLGTTSFFIIFFCSVNLFAQNTTNSGTEFWTAYMDHNSGAAKDGTGLDGGSLMSLYITSAVNTSGTITIADASFPPILFTVLANQVTTITMPASAFLSTNSIASKGIHIVTVKPVVIYAHIYAKDISGATLLLPLSTLGKDYYSINFTQNSNVPVTNPAYSAFVVVATENNTTVQITPTATLLDGHVAGTPFAVNLNKGQVYQALSTTDLTGSLISSINSVSGGCTKIAVFSGSTDISIGINPLSNNTSDNLFQQVYPTAAWGKNYITAPLKNRNYDEFRIVLSNPGSAFDPNVMLNGTKIPFASFTNGYYQFPSQQPNVISSDQPIQVVQYAVTQHAKIDSTFFDQDLAGDPEMIFLNPIEQTVNNVTLYSTGNFKILNSFINVIIKTNAVPTFLLDGQSYTNFSPVPNNVQYSYAQIAVQTGPQDVQTGSGGQGTHHLSAGDSFNAIAYGFGVQESYGYSAGTNLQNLNENIALANPADNTIFQPNGCAGAIYKLQLTLPYQTTNIVWNLTNGTTFTDNNPQLISTITQGSQKLYVYQYNKPVVFNTAGDYSVSATVLNPVAGVCGNNEVVTFNFNISLPPIAAFLTTDVCFGNPTAFTDISSVNGNFIKNWVWDFGDNSTSVLQNPAHVYSKPGNYKITLTVTNGNGCSDASSQQIVIKHPATAAFTTSAPACAGQAITFTDKSTSQDINIVSWMWDFGDGITNTLANGNTVAHTYTSGGLYTVTLTVITADGCTGVVNSQAITVNALPVADFILPAVCNADIAAQFTDNTTISDGSNASLTYLWNFGDANSTVANPNTSTKQNSTHQYTLAGNYNVSLTVTSAGGCPSTKMQTITINGEPTAAFSVENSNALCSSDDVVFDDLSSVSFGNVTKEVWYFDYNNNPNVSVVYLKNNLPADNKYSHNYGQFNTPISKTYQVRQEVYTGNACVSVSQQNITVLANPIISISNLGTVCLGSGPVQIIENKNGFGGTGVFSGPGVTNTGLFDPAKTGPGKFYIGYTFTSINACTYSTTQQVTVAAVPTVSLVSDLILLEGGQVTLPAIASGDNLTYKWTPSAGLDHDDILNPIASPTENVTYKLIVTNAEGCTAAASVNISLLKGLKVPNTFTPNGDGINDTWDIKYLDQYPNCTVNIFNRYGEKVYSSIGYPIPWDGKFNGKDLPQGTYYYIINPGGNSKVISGNLTIIR